MWKYWGQGRQRLEESLCCLFLRASINKQHAKPSYGFLLASSAKFVQETMNMMPNEDSQVQ